MTAASVENNNTTNAKSQPIPRENSLSDVHWVGQNKTNEYMYGGQTALMFIFDNDWRGARVSVKYGIMECIWSRPCGQTIDHSAWGPNPTTHSRQLCSCHPLLLLATCKANCVLLHHSIQCSTTLCWIVLSGGTLFWFLFLWYIVLGLTTLDDWPPSPRKGIA